MKSFLEFKGQSTRLDYDRERAVFVTKVAPHPSWFASPRPKSRSGLNSASMPNLRGEANAKRAFEHSSEPAHTGFFEKRQLQRYAGIWSLWALGVGAVISGHFSGWNYGLAVAGWGGLLAAAAIMAFMFLCLVFCIAEMSAALPDAGATYVFARRAMGPWGGFLSGYATTSSMC